MPTTYTPYYKGEPVSLPPLKMFLNFFYPVGSYYETTDTTFDPNTSWTGTWELEAGGLVHVSAGTNYAVTSNVQDGGEATHTLTIGEMPSHYHGITIGGYTNNVSAGSGFTVPNINNQGGRNNPTTSPAGGGKAHNNMQPYKIVNRWHRTA